MSPLLKQRLELLAQAQLQDSLRGTLHGIEKESLRIDAEGTLSRKPHPEAWGSALAHPTITTDYSEALVELITPVINDIDSLFDELDRTHRFAYSELGDELLWTESMPCRLPACDNDIPIGWYGTSNVGMLKHVYRRGLAVRYGKPMQCIAGIHYNYSLSPAVWQALQQQGTDARSAQDYQSERYVALIRNFRRYGWILMYLFGASPALCASFLQGREHQLQPLGEHSLYLPYATSLRMSDLGYNNDAQAGLNVCYNSLESYNASMRKAISLPYPPYAELGTHDADGQWQQLNTNLLQIENEFYSSIRPKRVTRSGEKPVHALAERGVEYVEVRCLDIDPFAPMGIDPSTAYFLDSFLLFCAMTDSPAMSDADCETSSQNFDLVVLRGREPGLQLTRDGQQIGLQEWGEELLDSIAACAGLLDQAHQASRFSDSLELQRAKLRDPAQTPSARVLAAIGEHGDSFFRFALGQSEAHREHFHSRPLDAAEQQAFAEMARQSVVDQQALEAADTIDFDTYLARYLAQ